MRPLIFVLLLLTVSFSASAKTLLVLGDSLSAAYGIDEDQGWVQLLRNKLKAEVNAEGNEQKKAYRVINASITGETSAGGLARLPKLLSTHSPDVVIIELGANDGLRGYPIKTLKLNLERMTSLARDANAELLLLGMKIPPNYGARYTQAFSQAFVQTAEKLTLPRVPFFLERVAINPELMQKDGIHPNVKAQPMLLDNVLPHLLPLLVETLPLETPPLETLPLETIAPPGVPPSTANFDDRGTR